MKNTHLDFRNDNKNYQNVDNELYLKDYIILLQIHIKKLIVCIIFFLIIGSYITINKTPIYVAKGTMIVNVNPSANTVAEITNKSSTMNQITNKMELLRSRTLAEDVVKSFFNSSRKNNLFLFGTRKFLPAGQRLRTVVKEIFTLGLYDSQESMKPMILEEPLTYQYLDNFSKSLMSRMDIRHIPSTNLIELRYSSPNADEARRIINKTMSIFALKDKEWSNQFAVNSVTFLDSLVYQQEKVVQSNDSSKMKFLLKNNLHSIVLKQK